MSELKPLDIVDDRTIEQIRADGDERWPDGTPYIKDGVCCVCGVNVEQENEKYPVHVCLIKLKEPGPCEVHSLAQEPQRCEGLAYWTTDQASMCDECILNILEHTPDNRKWLEPALADIRDRHLKAGEMQCHCCDQFVTPECGNWTEPGENGKRYWLCFDCIK